MTYATLLSNIGFKSDPFAQTNADEEHSLEKYFIPPPFFKAVYGDPSAPKSSVVFAPRGGGKTALKRKIEIASQDQPFLCVTYNTFNVVGVKLSQIDSAYHMKNIVRLVVVAVVTAIEIKGVGCLSSDERHLIYLMTKAHFSQIDQSDLKEAVSAVQNFNDKAKEFWNKFTGPVGFLLNALLQKMGLGSAEINTFESKSGVLGSSLDQLKTLQRIASKLGYVSIYVLIDKVDETSITGKSSTSYDFIESIVSDLQMLELPGFAFKFFLWDLLLDSYKKVARPDRIKYYILEWNDRQLQEMLSERLKAFSDGNVSSLNQITDIDGSGLNTDKLVSLFAQGSPRTMIRICKEILDQQSEIDDAANRVSQEAFVQGFERMAENWSSESFDPQQIRDLKRNKRLDFTIRHVYLNAFKFTQQAGLNKVKAWEDAGAVKFLGTINDTKGAKASNHYGISNLLLAKHVSSSIPVFDLVEKKVRVCPECANVLIRDWELSSEHLCDKCQILVSSIANSPETN